VIARLHLLFAVPLALAAAAAWPQQPVTVELHHRSAESLISVLRPLIGPATLAGAGARLQVRASPSDLPRVVRLIEQSDRPPQPLLVTLRDDPPPAFEPGAPAGMPATRGAPAGEPERPGQAGSIALSTGQTLPADPHGNGQLLSTRPTERPAGVVEGDPLAISMPTSQSLWVGVIGRRGGPRTATSASTALNPSAAPADAAGLVHFDAVTRVTARIWLAGETVAIDLRPSAAERIEGAPDSNPEAVTVYGRLGQWIALQDSGTGPDSAYSAGSGAPRAGLWIKIEAAPQPASE
jgi:hypothetical protein